MERRRPDKEEWIPIGIDDDGTQAFLDVNSIIRDLETITLFTGWVKHVPSRASRTYGEIVRALKTAKKNLAPPDHVKQLIEIDFAKRLFRTLNLVVCDDRSRVLDVISFRFPDWTDIEMDSIIDKVRGKLQNRFPDAAGRYNEPLKFSPPKVHMEPEGVQTSRHGVTHRSDFDDKLRLEDIDP